MLRRDFDMRKDGPCLRRFSRSRRFTPNLSVKVIVFDIGLFLRFSDSCCVNRFGDGCLRVWASPSVDGVRRFVGRSACLMRRTPTSWPCRQWLGMIANFWMMSGFFGSHVYTTLYSTPFSVPDTICAGGERLRSAVTDSELDEEREDLPG